MRSRTAPIFLPTARRIAYSTSEHGLTDVYVVSAEGGVPRAPHLGADRQLCRGLDPGWQGCSLRLGARQLLRLSPAVSHPCRRHRIAYRSPPAQRGYGHLLGRRKYAGLRAREQWQSAWKHYRGGQTTPVWLVNMKTLDLVKIPRENSNDSSPVWEGNKVYFLSDRNGPVSLFSYDTTPRQWSRWSRITATI
jgi:tricorn protease